MNVINCKGKPFDLSVPKVMGILNLTPDSFYDGNKHNSVVKALSHVRKMMDEGIDILDMGAASSRPGAKKISADEELTRLQPILKEITAEFPDLVISIDTFWKKVAEKTIDMGASIINDISAASQDSELLNFVSEAKVPYLLMHMKGTPVNMQDKPQYDNVVSHVIGFFIEKIRLLESKGITDVILDPGFGFGKSIDHNYQMLNKLSVFNILEKPILVGLSRKSMIYRVLGNEAKDTLAATTALHLQCLLNGAKILRAHDVKEANQAIKLYNQLKASS